MAVRYYTKPKVKYTASIQDYSGYGEAGRNAIRSLARSGVEVTVQKTVNVREKANFGSAYKEVSALEGKHIDYRIKIIHITPDGYLKHLEPMKYHIAHLFWETSRLPPSWVWNANLMNEIWTGDKYHADVFKASGVRVPINVFPQAIETDVTVPQPFVIENRPRFLFYSIFQFIERKNPELLLRAFWEEFDGQQDVGLLLKTYGLDFTENETKKVSQQIVKLKQQYALGNPPPILLYDQLLSRDDIFRFHATGDCFVLPHRGEGWGIPQVEALLMEKPLIATTLGGMSDWINRRHIQGLDHYKMVGVTNMDFVPWYTADQNWAEPSLDQLKEKMRWVYENHDKAKNQALKAKADVIKKFSFDAVGEMMKERLDEIYKELPDQIIRRIKR